MKESFENPSSSEETDWQKETRIFLGWLKEEELLKEEDKEKPLEEIVLTPYEEYRNEFLAKTNTESVVIRETVEFAEWLKAKEFLTEEDKGKRLARVDLSQYRAQYWEAFKQGKDNKE